MTMKDFWKEAVDDLRWSHLKDEWLAFRPAVRVVTVVFALILLLGMAQCAMAQSAVTVSLSADPVEGVETVTPTLTWSSTGAVSCEASGGWSGAKAVSGSETLPPIDRTTSFGLSCSAADGSAQLTWTAPDQYTNGDPLPLSELGGFKIYHGPRGGPLTDVVDIPDEAAVTYRVEGLPAGERDFAMTAYTDSGDESAQTNRAFTLIEVAASSADASVTVRLKPNPPVLVTVENFAYALRVLPNGEIKLADRIGTIAFGVPCGETPVVQRGVQTYYEVPAEHVVPRPSGVVVAACAAI